MRFPFCKPAAHGILAAAGGLVLALILPTGAAEPPFPPQGGEFKPARTLLGDQVHPWLSYGPDGGFLVWEDNGADGDGTGIMAIRLAPDLTPILSTFRVNVQGSGNQERPRVARLAGGGTAFAWLSGNDVFVRLMDAANRFTTATDLQANTDRAGQKHEVAMVPMGDGGIIVLWGSRRQDDPGAPAASQRLMQGVYGQRFNAEGIKVGGEFRVNQATRFNQRSAAGALLEDGRLIIVWISEEADVLERVSEVVTTDPAAAFRTLAQVEVKARLYDASLQPLGDEFTVNDRSRICANPAVAAVVGGGFLVTWSEKHENAAENNWDIAARSFAAGAIPEGSSSTVNSFTYGDQYKPSIAGHGADHLVVWTSLGQDGNREGIYGQFLSRGIRVGGEFRVNATTVSRQIYPVAAADAAGGFSVVWSGYAGEPGMDLYAQRYNQGLPRPPRPYVSALSSSRLAVSWAELGGFDGVRYALYVDQAAEPVIVTGNRWVSGAVYAPAARHVFRVAYLFPDGRFSPLSEAAEGRTWGADENEDGIPDDWQVRYFGVDQRQWAKAHEDLDGDGASTLQEFRAGTDPVLPGSVLRMQIAGVLEGSQLSWNTQPGMFYQVEWSSDLRAWEAFGAPRFAPGTSDAVAVGVDSAARYYRIILIR